METLLSVVTLATPGVIALATWVIAWATWQMHKTTKVAAVRDQEFREGLVDREEAFRKQLSDLYQALVIATIVGAGTSGTVATAIGQFRNQYKGTTPIFEEGA